MQLPPVLTIAGSDSSAGAGIQADLKTISAMGGYALTAVTSVVSETPGKVSKIRLLDPAFVEDQIRVLFEAFPIKAAKTGMLGGRSLVEGVVAAWESYASNLPLVVDPVMVATGGGKLLEDDAISVIKKRLLPLATLITPNMDEAGVLWGRPVHDRAAMAQCAHDLSHHFGTAVLVKGRHLQGDSAADVLFVQDTVSWLESPRIANIQTHGTGCTYSAAIATGLAKGLPLRTAVAEAKDYVARAISQHFTWTAKPTSLQALNHLQQTP